MSEPVMTPTSVSPMSTKGTDRRTVRIHDDVWLPAKAKAEAEGTDLSAIMRAALVEYVAEES